MTLSRFLRDYIYIPLGGNRKGNARTYINLLSTFLIGGLWHGAGWTFIIWGALHGIALAIHRFWQSLGFKMNKILAWFITFNFINITWIFFRAKDFDSAMKVLGSMFSLDNVVLPNSLSDKLAFLDTEFGEVYLYSDGGTKETIWLILVLILVLIFKNSMEYRNKFKPNILYGFLFLILILTSILNLTKVSEFLYFNF